MGLVTGCSHTLEFLEITHTPRGTFIRTCALINNLTSFPVGSEPGLLDLSTATNLHNLVFRPKFLDAEWITIALQTITSEHRDLQQILIHLPYSLTMFGMDVGRFVGEATCRGWLDLDRLLVQLWESCSVCPKLECVRLGLTWWPGTKYYIGCLFPEMTKRGIVDPVYYHGPR